MGTDEHDRDDRSRVLSAARRRLENGIVDDGRVIDELSDSSGVPRGTLTQRWRSGTSVYADLIQEQRVALPEYPYDDSAYAQMSSFEVLSALSADLTRALAPLLDSDVWHRNAVGIVVADDHVRRLWQEHIEETLDRWAELVQGAVTRWGDSSSPDRVTASRAAVQMVASHHYAQIVLGQSGNDELVITTVHRLL